MDIESDIRKYIQGLSPCERFASFDYCFNYFQEFRESEKVPEIASHENIQQSCLHLGFYLASWGMLRGSAALLTKSLKIYEPVVRFIAATDPPIWEIDVHEYDHDRIDLLLRYEKELGKRFHF